VALHLRRIARRIRVNYLRAELRSRLLQQNLLATVPCAKSPSCVATFAASSARRLSEFRSVAKWFMSSPTMATPFGGFTQEEALGNSLDLTIPERLRGRHWSGYEKTMATGETRYGHDVLRVPAVHKDGRSLSIAFTVAPLHSAGPERSVTGIVAVIRDETSRFTEERNLRKRLAELEARTGA
jgi:PAS domain S-box-containing protein